MKEERVTLETSTGSKIVGIMRAPDAPTEKAIVVCPGFSGTAKDEEGFSKYAADRGYSVLAIDFFSHGDSPGKSVDLTLSEELEDLRAAVKFVSEKFGKVGIVGHSLGGLIACMGADESDALVLWSPAIQIKNVWLAIFKDERFNWPNEDPVNSIETKGYITIPKRWGLDNSGSPFAIGKKIWNEMCDLDWVKVVENIDVPVKIIQAQKDGEPYIGFNNEAFSKIISKKEFEFIDADHVFTGSRTKLYESTVDWFDENL